MNAEDLAGLIVGDVVPSMLVSWLATWVMRRLAPRFGLVDKPGARKVHSTPVARGIDIGKHQSLVLFEDIFDRRDDWVSMIHRSCNLSA